MFVIKGLDHLRLVGIWDEEGGKAEDFDPENAGGYRSAQTQEEQRACVARALEYYNSCTATGDFGLEPITAEQAGILGDASAAAGLAGIDFENWLAPKSRFCRYCGEPFIPAAPRQHVCKRPKCQRKRRADKMRTYRKKLKTNKNPA